MDAGVLGDPSNSSSMEYDCRKDTSLRFGFPSEHSPRKKGALVLTGLLGSKNSNSHTTGVVN